MGAGLLVFLASRFLAYRRNPGNIETNTFSCQEPRCAREFRLFIRIPLPYHDAVVARGHETIKEMDEWGVVVKDEEGGY